MTAPRTALLAPDKFKGTLSAAAVTRALAAGIARSAPEVTVRSCPIADGGDGTVDAALAAGSQARTTTVTGPTGLPHSARWALADDVAVVELAETVGLHALPDGDLAPCTASTRGLGELIRVALEAGARTIIVGLGGSASTDAGAGLLQGLGAHLLTVDGTDIGTGLEGLSALATVDLAPALALLDGASLVAANDVSNSLLGADGAAAVYGPQKGIPAARIEHADAVLAAAAALLDPASLHRDLPGAGAAGGTGFALFLLGARQRSGADAVFELIGVDAQLAAADVVVTGEGKLDEQTLQGKGPAEIARRARERGLPVAAVAGAITLDEQTLRRAGIERSWDLVSRAGSVDEAIAHSERWLVEVGEELGHWLADGAAPVDGPALGDSGAAEEDSITA
ncbi:glycerate kinase [Brachybacterium sp. P6-10-X1]|uniref:glycerate kinase n=1 Tax=Brachybacterium sp. P6-10-X1 TaxID=1903186 RepID=UPI000971A91B|nr:glycerate kinase [Brachybacterium sp. P6-10-X1]APX32400.1 glycerate kinase [Brachybacterium sp. P6-10-X1]